MGDVTCATCGETWDTYHLRHDEVYETEAGSQIINDRLDREEYEEHLAGLFGMNPRPEFKGPEPNYKGEQWEGKLTPFWVQQFANRGWEFGGSVYAVIRCPCCKEAPPLEDAKERALARKIIAETLEDDEDGIQVMIEDLW